MRASIPLVPFALFALGCGAAEEKPTAPDEAQPAGSTQPVAELAVYDAICGHALAEVGSCGNYIKVGDEYVVLEYPSLGIMEFCGDGEKGARIKVAGMMQDGKFVASSYERVN